MPDRRCVLLVTDRFDPTADVLVAELNRRGVELFRFDTSEFPQAMTMTAALHEGRWRGRLHTAARSLDTGTVCGIYYRRPTAFEFDARMSAEECRWAGVQARLGFGGLLASLGPWLNHPHSIGYAEYKPVQLSTAVAVGLDVPRTILTNDPHAARSFVESSGTVLCKPFGGTVAVTDTDGVHQIFATRVSAEQAGDHSVARTAHLFQEWVPKDHEVRLTVVGKRFFAARIDTDSEAAHTDWRSDYRAVRYRAIDTPSRIRIRVTELMRRLRLRFAALDFVVTPSGEWYFLEVNPNGQWAWIEAETGLGISAAIADDLEGRAA